MTSSFRHGVTITGTVLLVTGTLCFAWWSDGEMDSCPVIPLNQLLKEKPKLLRLSSHALLRSVSFFCCGIGGLLLLFGLLWSVKANTRTVTRRYQYHLPRELHYISRELSEKLMHSNADTNAIPTYEEAMSCSPAENPPLFALNHIVKQENIPPLYQTLIEKGWRHGRHKRSLSDSALLRILKSGPDLQLDPKGQTGGLFATPPPSYENISAHVA